VTEAPVPDGTVDVDSVTDAETPSSKNPV
jgi:hypothetical protein